MSIEVGLAADAEALGPSAVPPGSADLAAIGSPGHLLRPGGLADLRSDAERLLSLDARRLAHLLRRRRPPGRWPGAAFGRHVDLVRGHLAPIASRRLLAATFGREAFHGSRRGPGVLDGSPVRVAYAVRWLELRDGRRRPSWLEVIGGVPAEG